MAKGKRPSVIWLSFQECTGCTESLLRTSHPALDELIVDLISLDYHEALLAPSGHLAEEARKKAMRENDGKYVLVVEGAIPTKDDGIYCKIGGRTALDLVKEAADHAGAIIAIGSCASFGGLPAGGGGIGTFGVRGAAQEGAGEGRGLVGKGIRPSRPGKPGPGWLDVSPPLYLNTSRFLPD